MRARGERVAPVIRGVGIQMRVTPQDEWGILTEVYGQDCAFDEISLVVPVTGPGRRGKAGG